MKNHKKIKSDKLSIAGLILMFITILIGTLTLGTIKNPVGPLWGTVGFMLTIISLFSFLLIGYYIIKRSKR